MNRKYYSTNRREIVDKVKWSWFRAIGYRPHIYQCYFHNSLARTRASCAGTRGGKTESAGREASAYMIAGPFRIWIVAGSYSLGYKEFRVVRDALLTLDENGQPINPHKITRLIDNVNAGSLMIKMNNGSEIEVISIDKPKKSGWGEEVDLILISEASLIDNIGGESGVWNKMLRGRLSSRLGDVIIPTTPGGKDEWLYPIFMKGLPDKLSGDPILDRMKKWKDFYGEQIPKDPEYFSLQWESWQNTEGFLEDPYALKAELPKRIFDEQYRGMFVKWSGAIWLNDYCFDPSVHIIQPFNVPGWWHRVEIIDPGYSGLFAWLAAVVDEDANVYIIDEYSANKTVFADHVEAIHEHRKMFYGSSYNRGQNIPVWVDPEDPQCIAELSKLGLNCRAAINDVTAGFQAGGIRFKTNKLFVFEHCKDVIDSLMNHEWANQKDLGSKRKEANDKFKHYSDAVRYLNMAYISPSEKPKEEKIVDSNTISHLLLSNKNKLDDIYNTSNISDWYRIHN